MYALCQYLRYTMIYRFVIFEAIEPVVITKTCLKQNFNCFTVILIVLAHLVRFMRNFQKVYLILQIKSMENVTLEAVP